MLSKYIICHVLLVLVVTFKMSSEIQLKSPDPCSNSKIQLKSPDPCSNSDQIQAIIQTATIIFGQNIQMHIDFIREKVSKSQFSQWNIEIWQNKTTVFAQNNRAWYTQSCAFTCQHCNPYAQSLSYQIVGISANIEFKIISSLNSSLDLVTVNVTQADNQAWTSIIQASKSQTTLSGMARFIANQISSRDVPKTIQLIDVEVFQINTVMYKSYLDGRICFSWYGKCNVVKVVKDYVRGLNFVLYGMYLKKA